MCSTWASSFHRSVAQETASVVSTRLQPLWSTRKTVEPTRRKILNPIMSKNYMLLYKYRGMFKNLYLNVILKLKAYIYISKMCLRWHYALRISPALADKVVPHVPPSGPKCPTVGLRNLVESCFTLISLKYSRCIWMCPRLIRGETVEITLFCWHLSLWHALWRHIAPGVWIPTSQSKWQQHQSKPQVYGPGRGENIVRKWVLVDSSRCLTRPPLAIKTNLYVMKGLKS